MNRMVLLVVISLATAALLVPTGAVPFGTDEVNGDLVMAPAEGPNGDYAILNEDDEIELLLTDANPSVDGAGLDANAVTPLSRVFTITYTGDETAEVWLTDDSQDVRFYRGDDSDDSLEGPDNSITLDSSESLTVGLLVDTRGDTDVESTETFTVHAEESGTDDDGDGEESGSNEASDGRSGNSDAPDSGDNESDSDGGNDGNPDNGEGRIETPTPAPDTETSIGAGGVGGTAGQGGGAETTVPDPETEDTSTDLGPVELGGIGLGPLLLTTVLLTLLPGGLYAFRRYS